MWGTYCPPNTLANVAPQPCYTTTPYGAVVAPSTQRHMLYGGPYVPYGPVEDPRMQIYSRGPVGPWAKIGYLYNEAETEPGTKTLPLYARRRDRGRDRYDLRTVTADRNRVAITIAEKVAYPSDGDTFTVKGYGTYTAEIYDCYE